MSWRTFVSSLLGLLAVAASTGTTDATPVPATSGPSFAVSFPTAMSARPIDGHITLIIAKGATAEPRTLISEDRPLSSPALFGLTVDGMKPGATAVVDAKAFGWPLRSLSLLASGDYTVQAVLNR